MMTSTNLADVYFYGKQGQTDLKKEVLLVGLGIAFLAALAKIQIPMVPVPITGQSLGVLLIGASFGARRAVITTALYIVLGFVGLPFLASGTVGFTGGYLIGFVICAYVLGRMSEAGIGNSVPKALLQFAVGHTIIFACGLVWLTAVIGIEKAWMGGFVPFIPGAVIKTVIAALAIPSLWRLVGTEGK